MREALRGSGTRGNGPVAHLRGPGGTAGRAAAAPSGDPAGLRRWRLRRGKGEAAGTWQLQFVTPLLAGKGIYLTGGEGREGVPRG